MSVGSRQERSGFGSIAIHQLPYITFLFQLQKQNVYCTDIDYVEEVIDNLIIGGSEQLQVIQCLFYTYLYIYIFI